ncbi:arylesterase [Janthinobacterium sp.]|uniref:arylesterase n=1 Tax=Janthinobacterium sp. TaxID=1871054 RepID=UPI0026107E8E|nr:arylesterase [Janthinobacterium sp.]
MLIYLKKIREHSGEKVSRMRRRTLSLLPAAALLMAAGMANAYSAPKTLLVLGDSLSAEYGLARGTGWVALLEQRLKTQNNATQVVNASISGETTSGGRARLPALLAKHHPDVVLIELGANDGLRGLPVAAAEANLRAMGEAVKQAGAQVVLVGMRMPPNYGRDYADKFSAVYARLGKEWKAPLVPFMFAGVPDQPQFFQADRMHPTAIAHPTILNNIWPQLAPLLKARK